MKRAVVFVCAAILVSAMHAIPAHAEEPEVFSAQERSVLWNEDWEFRREEDSAWSRIDLPHDWSIREAFSTEYEAESGFLPGGTGMYRKSLIVQEADRAKRFVLEFEGVYKDAQVSVNGRVLGTHPYGYTSFAFDLSDDLIFDGKTENIIEVTVKNTLPSSRWYSGSGIYRDVRLTVTEPQYIARGGVRIETPDLAAHPDRCDTKAEVTVRNDGAEPETLVLAASILDADGKTVSKAESAPFTVNAGSEVTVNETVPVTGVKLWSLTDPNLYTCRTEVMKEDGSVSDTVDTRFGFRWMSFDNDRGFFLNGEAVKLKGVCLHHDLGALGAAGYHAALDQRLDLLQEMGINAIRSAHNPADGYFLQACSERGILVIEEAFDTWSNSKNDNTEDYGSVFLEEITEGNEIIGGEAGMMWSAFDVREMVLHSRNEPCLLMYSIGNEILGNIDGDTSEYPNYARILSEWIGTFTDTIPVTIADNMTVKGSDTQILMDTAVADAGGIVGLNYATGKTMDAYHTAHPDWCLYGSETASTFGSRGEYGTYGINQKTHQITAYDRTAVEWGMTAQDAWLNTISRDYIAGEFVWTGFDYLGEPEPWNGWHTGSVTGEGPAPNSSYFGIIDTSGVPKDAYYFYQSQWRDDITVLHVLPDWNPDNMKKNLFQRTTVTVYTNAPAVELFLNGKSLGKVTAETHTTEEGYTWRLYDGSLSWNKTVRYSAGTLEAVAYDAAGNVIAETSGRKKVTTCGEPAMIRLTADRNVLAADGRDLTYVRAVICDAEGNPVSSDDREVQFHLEGEGRILASDSGNPMDTQGYQDNTETDASRKTFHGTVSAVIQAGESGDELVITAGSDGLTSGVTRIVTGDGTSASLTERTAEAVMDKISGKGKEDRK